MQRRSSLALKLTILLFLIIVVLSGGLLFGAYYYNSSQIDSMYFTNATSLLSVVTDLLDGDYIKLLLDSIRSEEFQTLRSAAKEANDEEMILSWLKDHDLYDGFMSNMQQLRLFEEKTEITFIYLQSLENNISINIMDPSEDLFYMGSIEVSPPEYAKYTSNVHIDPTVSTTKYGWLCSAYDPVFDHTGQAVAIVGVDIDINTIMHKRNLFLRNMLIFSISFLAVSFIGGILFMNRVVIRPLSMLSASTDHFIDSERIITEDDVIQLPITSHDEIRDLYEKTRTMQYRLINYLKVLTAVTSEKERISTELNVATKIQADMLPRIFPPFPHHREFDIYASMHPAKEVGGDFYDFFLVDDDHLALVIADVSGKGVPAALFMVIAKTLIKSRAQMGYSPSQVLKDVNNQLCEGNDADMFVTVWLAVLEISTGNGIAANAGHEHPVIRRAGGKYELVVYRHSPAVASMEGLSFKEHPFKLNRGDTLFVYTDGVPEATNTAQELFGTDRMLDVLNQHPDAAPKDMLNIMRTEIDTFVGDAPQFDDITMISLHYNVTQDLPVQVQDTET